MDIVTSICLLVLLAHPFAVSFIWTYFGVLYLLRSKTPPSVENGTLPRSYSIIIPFFDEPEGALAAAHSLAHVHPRPVEIILVDDGSGRRIASDAILPPGVRIVRLDKNGGKARALNAVLQEVQSEIIVCMDADTMAITHDWFALLAKFGDEQIGAICGKIWPASPTGFLQHLQHLEYIVVIGLIKAAESTWGGLLTVSGAFVAYRRSALISIGGWSESSCTEDIDASWRLQIAGWRLDYASQWVCRVEMAPNLAGLWRQRRRWGMGLGRTFRDHLAIAFGPKASHVPVATLISINVAWIMLALPASLYALISAMLCLAGISGQTTWSSNYGAYLASLLTMFSAQLVCAAAIDGKPWRHYLKLIPLAGLFPVYYWCLLFPSFLAGFPRGLLRRDRGTWRRTLRRRETAIPLEADA